MKKAAAQTGGRFLQGVLCYGYPTKATQIKTMGSILE